MRVTHVLHACKMRVTHVHLLSCRWWVLYVEYLLSGNQYTTLKQCYWRLLRAKSFPLHPQMSSIRDVFTFTLPSLTYRVTRASHNEQQLVGKVPERHQAVADYCLL